jgi:protein-S-isoprenylcysteine O-methyltransferase Ste14
MEYGAPVAAGGRAQGLALEVQTGRVVILGEAGMLRAQRGRNGERVGMNVPGCDNRQLALNIMRWLSRVL